MVAKVSVSPLQANEGALLVAITRTEQYKRKVSQFAAKKSRELAGVGTGFYGAAITGTNELFQEGAGGVIGPRRRLLVKLPGGKRAQVQIDWEALSQAWHEEKKHRASSDYKGKHRSIGPEKFWLDEGKLRAAFSSFSLGRGKATSKFVVQRLSKGEYRVDFVLELEKLPVRFLDSALRRALIRGASTGRRETDLERMAGMPAGHHRFGGVYRAAWTEALRPLMRPLAMRLGRAMQEQIIKSLRR